MRSSARTFLFTHVGSLLLGLSLVAASSAASQTPPDGDAGVKGDLDQGPEHQEETRDEVRLSWSAPPGCVSEEELRQRVGKDLRSELVPERRRLAGEMQGAPGRFIATFTVVESERIMGRRILELSVRDCSEATESLELVAAMLLEGGLSDAERAAHEEQNADAEPAETDAPGGTSRNVEESPEGLEQEGESFQVWAGASFSLGFGMAPEVAPGGLLELGVRGPLPVWVLLQGGLWGRSWSEPSASGAQVGLALSSVSAMVCGGPTVWSIEWAVCLGYGHFFHSVSTQGVSAPEDAAWDGSTLLGSVRLSGPLVGPLGWNAGFRLDWAQERARYFAETASGQEELFLSASVYPSTFAGISLTF